MAGNFSALALGGTAPTKLITNAFSGGGTSAPGLTASTGTNFAKESAQPAMGTANTLTTNLTISSPGQVSYLVAYSKDVTPRTIRLQVIADGTTVFDNTASNSISVIGTGVVAVGSAAGSAVGPSMPLRFNSSLVVKVASSIIEGAGTTAVAYILG